MRSSTLRHTHPSSKWSSMVADPRLDGVYALAEDCLYEAGHAHQVARLALQMFDQLKPVHGRGSSLRFILLASALLHDIGQLEGSKGHHKRSLHYIVHSPLLQWSERRRAMVGCVARYHRKAVPQDTHLHFRDLSSRDQRDVRVLSGMLRVADALDRGHRGVVQRVNCRVKGDVLHIRADALRLPVNELEKALQKSDLLRKAFDARVDFDWRILHVAGR